MEAVSDELLREPIRAHFKRERSRSYSPHGSGPNSSEVRRPGSGPGFHGGGVTSSGTEDAGRHISRSALFELTPLGDCGDAAAPSTRFGVEGLRIGRDPGCSDLVLPLNAVSRLHCVLSVLGDEVFVHDNSFNGTFINGRRVGKGRCALLQPRDTLCFLNPTLEEAPRCAFEFAPLPGLASSGFRMVEGLQRYDLGPVLGQGSFAAVRLGIDRETGAAVAIKLMERRRLSCEDAAASLRREIEMMRSMDHPHVVRVLDAFEGADCVALVMEYVRGGDLFDYVVGRGRNPFTETEARHLFVQLLEATLYIHGRSIIHCDLKPENVLVDVPAVAAAEAAPAGASASDAARAAAASLRTDSDGVLSVLDNHQVEAKSISPFDVRLKLTDFGIAKYDLGGRPDTGDPEGVAAATPVYAAPELAGTLAEGATPQRITAAVDVWSLGVLLYILCSGTVPKHPCRGTAVVFNRSMALLSSPCRDLIAGMMAPDPTQRPTLAEICHHRWLDSVAIYGATDACEGGEDGDNLSVTAKLSPRTLLASRSSELRPAAQRHRGRAAKEVRESAPPLSPLL